MQFSRTMKVCIVLLLYFAVAANGQLRIMNGEDAVEGEFPYQALIRNTSGAYCGGSIIHKRWILTAAHCEKLLLYGETKYAVALVGSSKRTTGGIVYEIDRFYRHEDYYSCAAGKDIALVRVAKDIEFSNTVKPVKLPVNDENKFANYWANITGFGRLNADPANLNLAENLQKITVTVITNKRCEESWGNLGLIEEQQICTVLTNGKSVCSGDSGGPLVTYGTQIGIVSYADGLCGVDFPNVFTRVSSFLPWIKYQLGLHQEQLS